jgi:hypothetical protein
LKGFSRYALAFSRPFSGIVFPWIAIILADVAVIPAIELHHNPTRDETLIRGLVRPHRWRRKIESGRAKSITDLAEQEGVTDAYVCRLLPVTCLAPDIVEAILDGRQPKGLRLAEMLGNGPLAWKEQRAVWLGELAALPFLPGDRPQADSRAHGEGRR